MNHASGCHEPGGGTALTTRNLRQPWIRGYEEGVKVLCPACERLITLEAFHLDGEVLVVTCSRCGEASRVERTEEPSSTASPPVPAPVRMPAPQRMSLASTSGGSNVVVLRTSSHEAVQKAADAADTGPFEIPEGVCPKCIARKSPAAECPHCGIRFASFDEAAVLPVKWLHEDWVGVLHDWGNESKHTLLRRKAQQADALASVARLYRLRQAAVPEDPVAAEALSDIVRLAAVPIGLPRTNPDLAEKRRTLLLASIVALLMVLLVGLVLRVFISES